MFHGEHGLIGIYVLCFFLPTAAAEGSPVQGELAAGRPTEGLEFCCGFPVTENQAGFPTPPPLRGTSPYTGEALEKGWVRGSSLCTGEALEKELVRGSSLCTGEAFRKRHSNFFLAQVPQDLSRPSSGGRISGSGAAAPAGGRRIGTAGSFRFLFGHEKERANGRQPSAKKLPLINL